MFSIYYGVNTLPRINKIMGKNILNLTAAVK